MKKLKGIKLKRVDGVINDGPQIKCKDGKLSYSVLGCENRGGVAESSIGGGNDDYGYGPVGPAKECPPGTMHDRTRGGACVDIELLKKEGKFDSLFPGPIKHGSSTPVTTKTMGFGGANWLLPALLVGIGIYLLTRKSE
jgi:hypothetical protein